MTDETAQVSERKEIEMLVPFHVTGRISVSDARRVENYLKRNPDFPEHIELARGERAATAAVNEVLSFPSARSAAKIFEAIAAKPAPRRIEALKAEAGVIKMVLPSRWPETNASTPPVARIRCSRHGVPTVARWRGGLKYVRLRRLRRTRAYQPSPVWGPRSLTAWPIAGATEPTLSPYILRAAAG